MAFIIFKDDREEVLQSLPGNIVDSLAENLDSSFSSNKATPISAKLLKSLSSGLIKSLSTSALLDLIPQVLPGSVFDLFHTHYKDRLRITRALPVDIRYDSEIVSFSGATMEKILADPNDPITPNDNIVFRFICNPEQDNYSGLNLTPVIMRNGAKVIRKYSNKDGHNVDIKDDATEILLQNFIERRDKLSGQLEFQNDVQGIAFNANAFIKTFNSDRGITVFFTIENIGNAFRPKTNIAVVLTEKYEPYKNDFAQFINKVAIHNHGSECC